MKHVSKNRTNQEEREMRKGTEVTGLVKGDRVRVDWEQGSEFGHVHSQTNEVWPGHAISVLVRFDDKTFCSAPADRVVKV